MDRCLEAVRTRRPLIHNITNYVTANDVANMLLACGASPIMADEPREVEEIAECCAGLCINIGTLCDRTVEAMLRAGQRAGALGRVLVLDPVGAGASVFRTETARSLMKELPLTAIRGNMTEIKALFGGQTGTRGVDAALCDRVRENDLDRVIETVKAYARAAGTILAVTGAADLVTDGERCYVIRNGREEMEHFTGAGCQLSGLLTAYLAAAPGGALEASAAAVCTMGLAGELAWERMRPGDGNTAYRDRIIDAVYRMDTDTWRKGARYEIR